MQVGRSDSRTVSRHPEDNFSAFRCRQERWRPVLVGNRQAGGRTAAGERQEVVRSKTTAPTTINQHLNLEINYHAFFGALSLLKNSL